MNQLKRFGIGVAQALGFLALATLFFWILPVIVAKNVGSAAERLSDLPGVKPTGGIVSGLAILVYPLIVISLLAAGIVLAGDVVGDDNGDTGTDDGESGDGLNETAGNETDVDGNESDVGEETNETDTDDGDGDDDGDYVEPGETGYDSMVVDIWPFGEEKRASEVGNATVTLYDSAGNQVEQRVSDDGDFTIAPFLGLEGDEEYTISATNIMDRTYPPVNKTVQPRETGDEATVIEAGYEFAEFDSHKSVYVRDYVDFPEGGDAKSGGYYEFAENDDALQQHTNARRSPDGGIYDRWAHITYTDGETNRTFHIRQDDWEEDPDRNLVEPRKTRDQRTIQWADSYNTPTMEFIEETTLEGSGVAQEIDGVEDRIPQVNQAAAAHDGRTVHVYYHEKFGSDIDKYVYIDVETKELLRMEFGFVPHGYDDPIWYTVDYWDHGNVESVDEYSVEELES